MNSLASDIICSNETLYTLFDINKLYDINKKRQYIIIVYYICLGMQLQPKKTNK